MKPLLFDLKTCKELIGDATVRVVEASAREDADRATPEDPFSSAKLIADTGCSYWSGVICRASREVYHAAFIGRLARKERMAAVNFAQGAGNA